MDTMRGIVLDHGSPTLRDDLPVPTAKGGEVRIRVTHSTVNGHEFDLAQGWLTRLMGWLRRAPGRVRTGLEFAGIVDSEGDRFKTGDVVIGYVDMINGWKTHADLIAIPETHLAHVDTIVAPAEAAALPMSGQTALVALREVAGVRTGDRVLIVGAAGGVGVMAVQIASLLGAATTAVAAEKHHALLLDLGAEAVVDQHGTPFQRLGGQFDAIFDLSATLRFRDVSHLLKAEGVFVPADPIKNMADIIVHRQTRWLLVDRGDGSLLSELAGWAAEGRIRAVLDSEFDATQWRAAVERSHQRGKTGRVVLAFA